MFAREIRRRLSPEVYASVRRWADLALSFRRESYSQFGEDLFLAERFKNQSDGFFVDVGAYHPKQLSNTYALYRRGWRGVNIDATPGSMKLFQILRPRDINMEAAISCEATLEFASWGLSPENTASRSQIDGVSAIQGVATIARLTSVSLKDLIARLPEPPANIDLLNVDAEGLDFQVIQSFDWQSYHPAVVIVEQFADTISQVMESELYAFIVDKDYRLASWHRPSLIFESVR